MNQNQSKINEIEARIAQLQTSDLFTDIEREHRLQEPYRELMKYTDLANNIEVINPEIL
jgi:hypothetical protein